MVEKRDCPPEWFEDDSNQEQIQKSIKADKVTLSSREEVDSVIHDANEEPTPTVIITDEEIEPTIKPQISIWKLLSRPRLIAASLISFANGTVFNVFEVYSTLPCLLCKTFILLTCYKY